MDQVTRVPPIVTKQTWGTKYMKLIMDHDMTLQCGKARAAFPGFLTNHQSIILQFRIARELIQVFVVRRKKERSNRCI